MFDNSQELKKEDKEILNFIKDKKAIILLNKTDLDEKKLENEKEIKNLNKKVIKISLKEDKNISEIYNELENMFNMEQLTINDGVIITNIRHKRMIEDALDHLKEAKKAVDNNMPVDIISIYIKEAMQDLGRITGENVSENVIKEIFSKFCLGK